MTGHVTSWHYKKIDSGTQVKQDNFKKTIEKFAKQINTIQKNLNSAVKDK